MYDFYSSIFGTNQKKTRCFYMWLIKRLFFKLLPPKEGRVNNVSGLFFFIILIGKYMTRLDESN